MSGKLIEMPKSIGQRWSDLFRGRKLNASKYNAAEFDELFSGFKRDIAKVAAHQQSQEMVNLDDLGIGLGSDFIDPRDEEPYWSDSLTEIERQNSIKGR